MNRFFSILRKILTFILVITLILSVAYLVYFFIKDRKSKTPPPPPTAITAPSVTEFKPEVDLHPEHLKPALHIQKYAVGNFGPDDERIDYESGSMKLYIPKLNTDEKKAEFPVLSVDMRAKTDEYKAQGMSDQEIDYQLMVDMNTVLDNGVALFNQAQLPGPENRNVSIAGHRDYLGMEFYYIDKITKGDLLYLYYEDKEYVYEYQETFITNDSDWAPIAVSDKSKLTLQSCDPIFAPNGDYDRIFVVANLIDIIDPEVDNSFYGPTLESGRPDKLESSESSDWVPDLGSQK